MELCIRIALWMFFFIGCLQAKPISSEADGQSDNPGGPSCDSSIPLNLLQSVICNNVNFTVPTNLMEQCYTAALKHYQAGLERAKAQCQGNLMRLDQTLDALDTCTLPTSYTQCSWENQGSSELFPEFVKGLEDLIQRLKNYQ